MDEAKDQIQMINIIRQNKIETENQIVKNESIISFLKETLAKIQIENKQYSLQLKELEEERNLTTLELEYKKNLLNKLKEILDSHGITYTFEKPKTVHYDYGDGNEWDELYVGYIDHGYDTYEFVYSVLENDDMLIRYLFSDSHVYTGNDNDEGGMMCNAAEPTIWKWDSDWHNSWEEPNPNHDEEKYEYFYKGN